ncbi:MAG TPA: hypothetical protein VIV11_15250 [Kofleriaceae bacterium]
MTILRIDHVQLPIPPGGEARAREFYAGVLGLVEVPKPEPMRARGGMWFDGGIHLGIEPDMRPSLKMHPALVVDDLDALIGQARRSWLRMERFGRATRRATRSYERSFRQPSRARRIVMNTWTSK